MPQEVAQPTNRYLHASDLSRSHRVWAVVLAFLGLIIGVGMAADSASSTTWAVGLLFMLPPKQWNNPSLSRGYAGLAKIYAVTWVMAISTAVAYLGYTLVVLI